MSDFTLSAVLELRDRMTGKIKTAAKGLDSVRSMAGTASSSLDRASASMDKAGKSAGQLQQKLSMLKGNHDIRVNARDNATSRIGRIRQELTSLTGKAYTAVVNIKQNGSAMAGKAMSGLSEATNGVLMGAGMQMLGAAGIGFGAYNAVKGYMDFEAEMSNVAAISGASGKEFEALTAKAQQMGATTMFTSKQAAEALRYMGMAGWDAGQMMGGIEGIMNLAAASGEDLGRVSDIVTDALTAFGLKAEDAGHFADVLAKASSKSNTNVSMLGETFKYVAPMAGALKYSIEDVAAAAGLMANAGVKGEQAGTSLRAIMTRLVKPTKESGTYLDMLTANTGIAVNQMTKADGTMKSWRQTMTELRKAFSTLSDAEKAEYAGAIAGQEAMSGFLAIMNASDVDFSKIFEELDHADEAAKKQAEKRMDNLAGDMTYLASAWDGLTQKMMKDSGAASGLRNAAKEMKSLVDKFTGGLDKGLDVAIVETAAKAVTDLKDKFLQLDGVGSILAGGALALGIGKIISLSKRAYGAVRQLASMRPGTGGGAVAVPSSVASSVSSMVVHAGSVVVNGKSVAGGGAVPAGGKNSGGMILGPNGKPLPPATATPAPATATPAPSPAPSNKGLMLGTGALAAVIGAMDIASTKADRERISKEEIYSVELATKAVKEANDRLWALNNNQEASDEERQTAASELVSLKQELASAIKHQKDSERMSVEAMGDSVGGAVGSVAGTVIGAALGGPAGAMIGGVIGDYAGKAIGEKLSYFWQDDEARKEIVKESVQETVKEESVVSYMSHADDYDKVFSEDIARGIEMARGADGMSMGDFRRQEERGWDNRAAAIDDEEATEPYSAYSEEVDYESIAESIRQQHEQVEMSKQSVAELMQGFRELDNAAMQSGQSIANASTEAAAVLQETVPPAVETLDSVSGELEAIDMDAEVAGLSICQAFQNAAADTQTAWEPLPPFFQDNIYIPIGDSASTCGSSAAEGINSGIPLIRSAWEEITGWLANQFEWISSKASALASAASSVFRGSGDIPGHASGTSYFEGGWTEINEHGGEIIDLPQGSRIYPYATTMEMLKSTFLGYEGEEKAFPLVSVQEIAAPTPAMEMVNNTFVDNRAEPHGSMTDVQSIDLPDFPSLPKFPEIPGFPALPKFPEIPGFPALPKFPELPDLNESQFQQFQPAAVEVTEKIFTEDTGKAFEPQMIDFGAMLGKLAEKLSLSAKESGDRKEGGRAMTITITGNEFTVREEADIDRIAYKLQQLLSEAMDNYNYVEEGM